MAKMVSWLHLSDLYFGSKRNDVSAQMFFSSMLNDIEAIQQNFDMIFVSGDIAYTGDVHDYKQAESFFLELLQITRVSKDNLFFVPGNHDIKRNISAASQESMDDINTILSDDLSGMAFSPKFQNYIDFLGRISKYSYELLGSSYTRNMEINGTSISVVGFNSMCSYSSYDEKGQIVLGERLAAEAYSKVRQAEIVITLMHHPPHYFGDGDASKAGRIIDSRSDFVLHGHSHESTVKTHIAPGNMVHYIVSGATCDNYGKNYAYNCVSVNLDSNEVQVLLRLFDPQNAIWRNSSIDPKAPDGVVRLNFRNNPDIQHLMQQGLQSRVNVGENKVPFQRGYSIGSEPSAKENLFIPGIPKPLLSAIMQKNAFCLLAQALQQMRNFQHFSSLF